MMLAAFAGQTLESAVGVGAFRRRFRDRRSRPCRRAPSPPRAGPGRAGRNSRNRRSGRHRPSRPSACPAACGGAASDNAAAVGHQSNKQFFHCVTSLSLALELPVFLLLSAIRHERPPQAKPACSSSSDACCARLERERRWLPDRAAKKAAARAPANAQEPVHGAGRSRPRRRGRRRPAPATAATRRTPPAPARSSRGRRSCSPPIAACRPATDGRRPGRRRRRRTSPRDSGSG